MLKKCDTKVKLESLNESPSEKEGKSTHKLSQP